MDYAGSQLDPAILFEDEALFVIDKPSGMVVNRSETTRGNWTVQEWAEERYQKYQMYQMYQKQKANHSEASGTFDTSDTFDTFFLRSGIVHRLDKETSGCLVVAKNPEAFGELVRQFKERTVKKEYIALAHGVVEPNDGTIRVPLQRSKSDRQRFAVSAGGRSAETSYRVEHIHHRGSEPYSFITIWPKTGRTHQIRVHLAYFGHPLVSDPTYGGRNRSSEDRIWCPRMFLHAAKISFIHPVKKTMMTVKSPVPLDLQAVLSTLS